MPNTPQKTLPFFRMKGSFEARFTGHGHIRFSPDLVETAMHDLMRRGELCVRESPGATIGFMPVVIPSADIITVFFFPCLEKSLLLEAAPAFLKCVFWVSTSRRQVGSRGLDRSLGMEEGGEIQLERTDEYDTRRIFSEEIFTSPARTAYHGIVGHSGPA